MEPILQQSKGMARLPRVLSSILSRPSPSSQHLTGRLSNKDTQHFMPSFPLGACTPALVWLPARAPGVKALLAPGDSLGSVGPPASQGCGSKSVWGVASTPVLPAHPSHMPSLETLYALQFPLTGIQYTLPGVFDDHEGKSPCVNARASKWCHLGIYMCAGRTQSGALGLCLTAVLCPKALRPSWCAQLLMAPDL